MKSSELRIGSYVHPRNHFNFNGSPCNVNWGTITILTNKDAHFTGWSVTPLNLIDPILLTEEWLVKLGFAHETSTFDIYKIDKYQLNDFFLSFASFGGAQFRIKGKDFEPPQFVHQLQNIYFEIHGEILKIRS
jgi:hypothetical protein